jgi:hypothetical protein
MAESWNGGTEPDAAVRRARDDHSATARRPARVAGPVRGTASSLPAFIDATASSESID